ncbi:hypothetical protein F5X68DRAFT_14791 [Plectosphaerella plurivora]|uniref:Uncharacterized protein n=1 Tax=Plectosphaerella plurivora TaxID=936078 RepID=A0A9P8VAQ3_9PEZI|nr:hypothetical protein F5X68DRAFT_14791 [Plectosphaerella plurivora]
MPKLGPWLKLGAHSNRGYHDRSGELGETCRQSLGPSKCSRVVNRRLVAHLCFYPQVLLQALTNPCWIKKPSPLASRISAPSMHLSTVSSAKPSDLTTWSGNRLKMGILPAPNITKYRLPNDTRAAREDLIHPIHTGRHRPFAVIVRHSPPQQKQSSLGISKQATPAAKRPRFTCLLPPLATGDRRDGARVVKADHPKAPVRSPRAT